MASLILAATIMALVVLLFTAGGAWAGWKAHEVYLAKTQTTSQQDKRDEVESMYLDKSRKFLTHKIVNEEDD